MIITVLLVSYRFCRRSAVIKRAVFIFFYTSDSDNGRMAGMDDLTGRARRKTPLTPNPLPPRGEAGRPPAVGKEELENMCFCETNPFIFHEVFDATG